MSGKFKEKKMLCTTLNKIRAHSPFESDWKKLLAHLGKNQADDEPLPFATILDSNGLDEALWCCRSAPEYDKEWRLFAVWCARQVQHLMTDQRSIDALDVAERYANGEATKAEFKAAGEAACAAGGSAAGEAAWAAAGEAAGEAAGAAAGSAAGSAAWTAAWTAAGATAWADAWTAQETEFLRIVGE